MVLANNAIYTDGGEAIRFPNGSDRVQVAGNVILGRVVGVSRGYAFGADLSDFTEVSWDASNRDVRPSKDSALLGRGVFKYSVEHDYLGEKRFGNPSSGCLVSFSLEVSKQDLFLIQETRDSPQGNQSLTRSSVC